MHAFFKGSTERERENGGSGGGFFLKITRNPCAKWELEYEQFDPLNPGRLS